MAQSVIQDYRECFICGRTEPLHVHHCFEGSYRKKSDLYGLTVYLCPRCHMKAHEHESLLQYIRAAAQKKAMEYYGWTEDEFRTHIGRSFL